MKMMLVVLLLGLSIKGFAGTDGHGGGGIHKDGRYMTFYSAGLYVEPTNAAGDSRQQLPVIDDLFNYLSSLDVIDLEVKTKFMRAILPTNTRQYHFASPEELTPEIYKRLMNEFKRVTGVDPTYLHLFALTDLTQKTTYLLPGFEKLNHDEQMTILYHEAYWIVYPDSTYNQVVNAEMAFQAALTKPNDYAATYDFVSRIGASHHKVVSALIKWDLSQGNLNGFLNRNQEFKLKQLYGEDFIKCIMPVVVWNTDKTQGCNVYFRAHLNNLIRQYPKSMILRAMAKSFDANGDRVVGYTGETGSGTAPNDEGITALRDQLWGNTQSSVTRIMNCPVHLLETDVVDCKAGQYFLGGHLLLNF